MKLVARVIAALALASFAAPALPCPAGKAQKTTVTQDGTHGAVQQGAVAKAEKGQKAKAGKAEKQKSDSAQKAAATN